MNLHEIRYRQGYSVKRSIVLLPVLFFFVAIVLSSCGISDNGKKLDNFYFYQNNQKIQCIFTSTGNSLNPNKDYCSNTTGDYYESEFNGIFLCKEHSTSDVPTCDLQKSDNNWAPPYTYRQIGILSLGLFAFLILFCTSSLTRAVYFIIQVCAYLVGWFVSFIVGSTIGLGTNAMMSNYIIWFFLLDVVVLFGFFSLPIKHLFGDTWYNKFALIAEIVAIVAIILITLLGWLIATA